MEYPIIADDIDRARKLAEEHWAFLEKWMHMVFVDGFAHGYKHARTDCAIVGICIDCVDRCMQIDCQNRIYGNLDNHG